MPTKVYRQLQDCPHCGRSSTTETQFGRWVRKNHLLDSCREGYVNFDLDMIVHRYRCTHGREAECLMLVEIKTHGKSPDGTQRDTLNIVGQFLRSDRKKTKNKKTIFAQISSAPVWVFSCFKRKRIKLRAFGYHLLQFEKNDPDDSAWIKWDGKKISPEQLVLILRFEIDPDTLQEFNLRNHHKDKQREFLFAEAQ